MWFRPRPVRIVILAVNLMTAVCGGGGGAAPAAPSEPSLEPVTRSFSGDWRGRYHNGVIHVMSRCWDEGAPLDFLNPGASEMTVAVQPDLHGVMEIARGNEMVTCPFAGRRDSAARLRATVDGESCTPSNARVPAQGYVYSGGIIPPGCQSRANFGRDPWAELGTFDITAAIDNTSRDYPVLIVNIIETGHFHDPRGDYYTGAYTAENAANLTHPEDPRVE